MIVTDKAAPYVLGTRLRVNHDKIAEIEIIWTTTGYWLFNADKYLKYSSTENWDPIPAEQRGFARHAGSAANAYLDAFLEQKIDLVPWGYPCVRIEGGMHTGKGTPTDSCEVGVPSGVNIANRRFVVDEVTRLGRRVLHLRRRRPERRQRRAGYAPVPRGERQAALRAHADAPAAVGVPRQRTAASAAACEEVTRTRFRASVRTRTDTLHRSMCPAGRL